jgi:hypothetical protein
MTSVRGAEGRRPAHAARRPPTLGARVEYSGVLLPTNGEAKASMFVVVVSAIECLYGFRYIFWTGRKTDFSQIYAAANPLATIPKMGGT